MSHQIGTRRAQFAHLAYTSLFERIIHWAGPGTLNQPYGSLVEVSGAGATVGVRLPLTNVPGYNDVKDAYHCCVVNSDGAHTIIVGTGDSTLINGGSGLLIPATAGAFAMFFFSNVDGEWIALVGGPGGAGALAVVSQTVVGTLNPIPMLAPGTVTTIPVTVADPAQHIHMNFDCTVATEGTATVTFTSRIDGVVQDTRIQLMNGSDVEVVAFGGLFTGLTVGVHTIDVQAQSSVASDALIPVDGARETTILLPG